MWLAGWVGRAGTLQVRPCLSPHPCGSRHGPPTLPSTVPAAARHGRKKEEQQRVARFACSEPSMARLYKGNAEPNKRTRRTPRPFVFHQFVSNQCSRPPSPGNCRRWDGRRWRDRPRHGCRGRAPGRVYGVSRHLHPSAKLTANQSRFGFGWLLPAAGGPPRVSAAPPHPTRSGSSRRCRRCRNSRSDSSPVLLVVVLGVVVRRCRVHDLGGDRAVAGRIQLRPVGLAAGQRGLVLALVGGMDRRTVLGAGVVSRRMPCVGSWLSQNSCSSRSSSPPPGRTPPAPLRCGRSGPSRPLHRSGSG